MIGNVKGNSPSIGIIMVDTVFPRIRGDVGNPDTFPFPVLYRVVKGASTKRVVKQADPRLLQPFIEAARALEKQGVKAIATSCGFLAIFHRELVNAVHVPVFSSSLLQVHLAQAIIQKNQKVGILTAHRQFLTKRHLAGVGIQHYPSAIMGMEDAEEFTAVFLEGKRDIDVEKCRREMVAKAVKLVKSYPDVGAIVLECTNMPPYARDIQTALQLPVFDVVTLINYAYTAVVQQGFLQNLLP
ncbi:MAG: aspartate/glutamate racemase family protein [Syntrophaceae bacterium]|nr:aspartate/glutamate racemase family protein [Syntrophaceae bacterium]